MIDHDQCQFTVLPCGLSLSLRVLTTYMAIVVAYFQHKDIQMYPYLNDWLVQGHSKQYVEIAIYQTL